MKTPTGFEPENLIRIIQLLLMQLEDTLSAADGLNEDSRADELQMQVRSYRDKASRLNTILAKHRQSERRKKELTQDNDRRNSPR